MQPLDQNSSTTVKRERYGYFLLIFSSFFEDFGEPRLRHSENVTR